MPGEFKAENKAHGPVEQKAQRTEYPKTTLVMIALFAIILVIFILFIYFSL
jgi:uncharacterized membrane protein YvbJ